MIEVGRRKKMLVVKDRLRGDRPYEIIDLTHRPIPTPREDLWLVWRWI